jgi:hypothetical protein
VVPDSLCTFWFLIACLTRLLPRLNQLKSLLALPEVEVLKQAPSVSESLNF